MLGISNKKSVSNKAAEFSQITDTRDKPRKDLGQALAIALVALVAMGMRIAFSYNISANSNFALSGGISSSEHLHRITELVTGQSFIGIDKSLNYPFGSPNTYLALFDLIMVPFVIIERSLGFDTPTSISMTLAWSGAIFGVLCTVSAYFLGKEILKSKKAGFLTSLFIALCPISIAQSIFSNGTGISFLAFLSTIFVYFVFRGIKNYDNFSEYPNFTSILKENKKSLKYALCSGLILSVVALSWSEFRPIVITTIFCMITLVLTDRLTGKDPKVSALFFSVILFTATIVSELYSTSTNLQMPAFPEIFILSTFSAILCLAFSSMHNKPLFTIPTFAILIVAALTVLYYIEPALFYNTILNDSISGEIHSTTTVESCLSLSKIAVFFGPLTMWSPFIVIGIILYSIKNKISSSPYVCAAVLLCFTTKYAIQSTELATIFAPVFAISFAYITIRLFAYINFQSYFTSLKAKGIGLVTRRIFKPIPFLSIFIILAIICSPNALHAIDASIPNNSNEYNGIDSGALGYNIKTDDEWKKNSVLLEYNDVLKCGAMATWVDHADEAAALGDFKVTVDSKGNGAISTSNIFLSKSPSAALLLHGIKCNGFDESKNILLTSGMTEDQFTKIRHCFDSPDKKAIKDIEVYRAIKTDISNESISYLEAENILVDSFSEQELSKLYRKLCNTLGKNIEYIMVTSSMFPISPNKDSSFTALANASGYAVNDQGIIPRFFDVNSEAQETYNYTDAMYETALWKTYIGMSPKEAGKITPHDYLSSLMLSNGKYKTTPGYGLFNYTVDNQHWYVTYNSDPNATLSSSGWVKMTATEAQDKQITNGGLINYLSGFPVILKYTNDSNIDHTINGHVKMGDVPVKGIYAAAMDKNRIIHSYDCTDADGKYEITAHDDQDQKIIFATSIDAFDAENVICTKMYNEISDNPDIMLPTTSLSGRIVGSNDEPLKISSPLKVTFTGRSTGNSLSAIPDHNTKFSFESIVPDTYDITITNESGNSICDTQSYKVIAGANNKDINVKIATCKVTVNTVDDVGVISGDTIIMTEEHGVKFEGTSSNGVAVIDVIPGTYAYSEKHGKIVTHSTSVISSDTSVTIKLHNSKEITINGLGNGTAIIYSKGYLKLCTGNKAYVPVGSGNTATYTLYSVTERGVCLSKIDRNTDEVNLLSLSVPAVEVSGTMMNSSNKAVSGTIIFIKDGMEVPTSSDSRGFYKVLLPEGTYSVYANHGSEVSIVKEFVSVGLKDIKDKNINLSNGTKIFGHTLALSHKLQPVTLSYIPIKVSSITGAEGVSFTTLSGPDGRYSFQIPSYSTCTLTGLINAEDSNYYYDEPIGITKIEKLEISSGETNFEANVKAAEITNNTCGDIWINETLVSAKEHAVIPAKGPTWKVALPYKETPYVTPESIIPVSTTEIIPSHFTNYAFSKLTLVGPTDKSTVTFKTLDGNTILYKTIAKGTQYLIESNKQFNIIVTGPEIGAVHKITKLSEDTVFNISDFNDYSLFHVRGYVGISKPGTLKVLSYNEKEQFESQYDIDSNGRYSIDLSPSYKHKLYAHVLVEDKDKLIHYVYSGQRELDEDFEPEKTYTRDLIVTSQEYRSNDTTISDIHIEKMTANAKSKIDFSFVITNNTGDSTTLLMHPGPGWTDLNFYGSDEFGKRTDEQISSITVDKFAKVHAIGIIDRNTVGLGSDDLSIGITDIQNRMVCIGTLDDDSNWNKTINNTSLVSYGSNSVTDQGYAYSIKIKNCDNFSKKYRIATSEIDNHWFQTLVNGNKIYNIDDDLIIHGYEEATVHVRITTINGKETGVPNANIEISRQNESFSTTDSEGQIQITTNSVIIKSETHKRVIEVCNMFASGEDVYIEGTIWHDIWILIGLVSLIVISLLWPSLKGMLSRRK